MAADSPEKLSANRSQSRGRDPEQQFHGVPAPDEGAHPPINFHAFAACTFGAFHRDTRRALDERDTCASPFAQRFRAPERALTELKREVAPLAVLIEGRLACTRSHTNCATPAKLSRFIKL